MSPRFFPSFAGAFCRGLLVLVAPLIALGSSALAAEKLVSSKPVLLFLCAGQSNMGGSGSTAEYNTAYPDARLPRPEIWFRGSNVETDTGGWRALGTQLQHGPEIVFALRMAAAFPEHTIAILKVERAATPIEYWMPGEPSRFNSRAGFLKLETLLPEVVADLRDRVASGSIPGFKVAGLVWMQGEADSNGIMLPPGTYLRKLRTFVRYIESKLETRDIPVVLGRISIQVSPNVVRERGMLRVSKSANPPGPLPDEVDHVNDGQRRGPVWYHEQLMRVRADQEAFVAERSRAAWVDLDDLDLIDGWHFFVAGYVEMGRRFGDAMVQVLKR